jgi:DMSO/TMAO reductase YedYZ molybdopterin-dependent catalytic subunit
LRSGPDRRTFLKQAGASAGALALGGCDRISESPTAREILDSAEHVTLAAQRLLLGKAALAREYTQADLSPAFRANGSTSVDDFDYQAMADKEFVDWRLEVAGLVDKPLELSLADLRTMPSRTQITRHDCVEGWSCIGKWKGVPLAKVLDAAGAQEKARYVVFRCADTLEETLDGTGQYYESIGFEDAYHPQTILAYEMNDRALPIPHGAPLRLRVERQLGYKMAKYIMRIELVDDFAGIGRGRGGFWEDRGYEWYAGI